MLKTTSLLSAVVAAALVAGAGIAAAPAQASHNSALVNASAVTSRAVIEAVNDHLGTYRPARCFKVWVARSNPGWATWGFSGRATNDKSCQPFDGFPTFFRRVGSGAFTYAGDVKPAWTSRMTCRFVFAPPTRVIGDLGCDRWSVRP